MKRRGGEPLETFDDRSAADEAVSRYAAEIVRMGLGGRYGAFVRFIRTGRQYACWGIFAEPLRKADTGAAGTVPGRPGHQS